MKKFKFILSLLCFVLLSFSQADAQFTMTPNIQSSTVGGPGCAARCGAGGCSSGDTFDWLKLTQINSTTVEVRVRYNPINDGTYTAANGIHVKMWYSNNNGSTWTEIYSQRGKG